MAAIDDSAITYTADGRPFGTHGARYLPERPGSRPGSPGTAPPGNGFVDEVSGP
ncbi:hypothetical protein GCM10010424_17940 [Streptomyces lienomycini]